MTPEAGSARRRRLVGRVERNGPVGSGLRLLEIALPETVVFDPGQFAMLNFTGAAELVFSRPFSILSARVNLVSFLYRVVGRGTELLAEAGPGRELVFLGPLGRPFPGPRDDQPVILVAGGVGLPPLAAWFERFGRDGDRAFFGARDGSDVPWDLLAPPWEISVDRDAGMPDGREAFVGLVVDLCRARLPSPGGPVHQIMACGPLPLLRATAALAAELGWPCLVSVEEHMGCGYGVCRGCVVPAPEGRRATACQDGPVFDARLIDWDRFGHHEASVG